MPLTELEKVAIFFVAIGPERAEALLKRLGTDAVMRIASAMKRLGPVTPEMKQTVLKEMLELLSEGPGRPRGPAARGGPASTGAQDDLLKRMSDLFDRDVDVRNLNWEAAGLNFDAELPKPPRPPGEDDEPPSRRR
ncbi:MAG: hypothetical protein A3F84_23735 [Candidatus Handelsmanbacteria bacterium RIFCSPLOWO2_12_FULL_64_10]|uniref:Flagellar motor switch protein FliG n=1 Tax=Handelsmanbacteria sp. (strain RIFCSPLOWO2_12_FULL_64_10) TaxID=1817868 RepID=A0A1F6CAP5_HANXR|nr:MAG: hypothetical protein A3F84_23735 [Candidatus Handelsmanbacteria bacterium RIFCSPLOWO2_12_FULL_64_10]